MFRLASFTASRHLTVMLSLVALAAPRLTAEAQVSVLSSTVEEHTGGPGEKYAGRIEIANSSRTAQVVRLYQTDYSFKANGTSTFDQAGSSPRSNSAWISLQSEQVTVPPTGTISVPYTVAVPKTDSLRGTYWSAIMVEPVEHPTPTTPSDADKPRVGLGTVIRYAVQVATHVGTAGARTVHFDAIEAKQGSDSASAAKSTLELDVINAGERAYRPALWVELYDAKGALRAQAKQTRGLLYPGCSLRQRFDLGVIPPGTYKAVIFADTGEETVYASQYTVVF
ncbi:MAG TPA: hypothetical protein VN651_01175 [Gemmatimonadaceae bacterium]|nr:hypothetical protein [Gemmatimonadaceae bacterium]